MRPLRHDPRTSVPRWCCCPTSGAATAASGTTDKLGQISLATTTLFWGVSGNLRYIVLAWAAVALGYSTTRPRRWVGVVAIGTAVGAVVASVYGCGWMGHPLGIAMGCW